MNPTHIAMITALASKIDQIEKRQQAQESLQAAMKNQNLTNEEKILLNQLNAKLDAFFALVSGDPRSSSND